MGAVLGIFPKRPCRPGEAAAHRLLRRMQSRGERPECHADDTSVVAVARHDWELGEAFSGDVLIAKCGELIVAADASIYYRAELARRLKRAGIVPAQATPSHMILAAYRAWGPNCVDHLEGDFAFLIWDRAQQQLFLARDFTGRRPLFYADLPDAFVVASAVSAVLAYPGCPQDLNVTSIAAVAADLDPLGEETSFRAVTAVPVGWQVSWDQRAGIRSRRYWTPPTFRDYGGSDFDSAAEELRDLLVRAVAERLPNEPLAVMTLSGGWDSSAVFGAGQLLLQRDGTGRRLLPVSFSFPDGDSGREDERISAIADHWGGDVYWIDTRRDPVMQGGALSSNRVFRDEPWLHPFEAGIRSLSRGTRARGARVALDGYGGDFLFHTTDDYLADLFWRGRWTSLADEWRANGASGSGMRNFARWCIVPALPPLALAAAGWVRGVPVRGRLERTLPAWLDSRFVERHDLEARSRLYAFRRRGESCAAFQNRWYFTNPLFARTQSGVHAFTVEEGVEFRSPLMDARVIDFAANCPRADRAAGRERKVLLRHAMRGIVPASILASRPHWTGTTRTSFDMSVKALLPAMIRDVRAHGTLRLAELGIVDSALFTQAMESYLQEPRRTKLGATLLRAVYTERWLRLLADGSTDDSDSPRSDLAMGVP